MEVYISWENPKASFMLQADATVVKRCLLMLTMPPHTHTHTRSHAQLLSAAVQASNIPEGRAVGDSQALFSDDS